MKMTESHGLIWQKPRNMVCLDLTETDNDERSLGEHDGKRLSLTENFKNNNNATTMNMYCWISPKICIFSFLSCSPVNVRLYGNFYFKFWSSSPKERSSLSAFGHVHRFRSASFGQKIWGSVLQILEGRIKY